MQRNAYTYSRIRKLSTWVMLSWTSWSEVSFRLTNSGDQHAAVSPRSPYIEVVEGC